MIRIAIVEDEKKHADILTGYLEQFGSAEGETFDVSLFKDAFSFLEEYRPEYDVIFLDIMMPGMDGMQAAAKLRQRDGNAVLIFVTSMAQFAVKGYEVAAFDFIVKPMSYYDFCIKMRRAVFSVRSRDDRFIVVPAEGGDLRIPVRDLQYIEVSGHNCRYHIAPHRVAEGRNTIRNLSALLAPYHFMRCNSCYLVNPSWISYVGGYTVRVGEDELQISHPRKKEFVREFNEWAARGGGRA